MVRRVQGWGGVVGLLLASACTPAGVPPEQHGNDGPSVGGAARPEATPGGNASPAPTGTHHAAAGRPDHAAAEVISPKDGAPLVRVAGGAVAIGSSRGSPDETPQTVELETFFIDRHEVTVAQYRRCVEAGACSDALLTGDRHNPPGSCNWDRPEREQHPLNCVDWEQAQGYCGWAGRRLPSEAEWERAARGTDQRTYPWGDDDPTCALAVFDDRVHETQGCGGSSTAPVGSRSPAGDAPSGAQDMAGNVYEWTEEWYREDYTSPPADRDPPKGRRYRTIRGGAWSLPDQYLRASDRTRNPPAVRYEYIGFRCAVDESRIRPPSTTRPD